MINEEHTADEHSSEDEENKSRTSNTIKQPDDWTTGDEEMTGALRSYLKTLSAEAGDI